MLKASEILEALEALQKKYDPENKDEKLADCKMKLNM